MHFRLKTFMPFAVFGALLVLIALTSPPLIYTDQSFLSGKRIEREFQSIRFYTADGVSMHPSAGAELPAHLARMDKEIKALLDSSRWRQLRGSSLLIAFTGAVVMLVGLFVTVLVSWKSDVSLLQTKQQPEAQP